MKAWVKGIIAGAVIAVIGIAVLIGGLYLNGWHYSFGMPEFETKTYAVEQDVTSSVQITMNAGRVKTEFYDGEKIVIEYPYAENYVSTISEDNGKLAFTSPRISWYKFWGRATSKIPFAVIKMPQNEVYDIDISLNAGAAELAGGTYGNVNIEVNAGAFSTGKIVCGNFDCDINAGAISVEGLICGVADFDVSAGASNIKSIKCTDISADVSAGALTMTVDGSKSEYNISASKSVGSCNVVSQSGSTENRLKVDVSAGSANINFTAD